MPNDPVEAPAAPVAAADPTTASVEPTAAEPPVILIEADLLVEDVSIDGMCGVY